MHVLDRDRYFIFLQLPKFYCYSNDRGAAYKKFTNHLTRLAREKNRIQQLRHLVEYIADIVKYTNVTVFSVQ